MVNDNDDNIFGRLENEMRQIEEQKRRNSQRVEESERNWAAQILLDFGKALGKVITGTFEFLSDLIQKLFGGR
jgi:hypothetical protein